MGLGLQLIARRRGWISGGVDADRLAQRLHTIAAGEAIIGPLAFLEQTDDGPEVAVLPIEEPVRFAQAGRDVIIDAKTSSGGPGYHAHVCELLSRLATAERIEWIEDDENFDETGYFGTRDYPALKVEMAKFFQRMMQIILERSGGDDWTEFRLGMALNLWPAKQSCFALTQRGPLGRSFAEAAAAADTPSLEAFALRYFPWWEQGVQRTSAFGLAEALMWCHFPWRVAENDWEMALSGAIQNLASGIKNDARVREVLGMDEFEAILDGRAAERPSASGPGYFRGPMKRPLFGEWTVDVPGYFAMEVDDDAHTITYWHDSRAVHANCHEFETPGAAADLGRKLYGSDPTIDETDGRLKHIGRFRDREAEGEDGEMDARYVVQGCVTNAHHLAVVTVAFEIEADRPWAEAVFRSIWQEAAASNG